MCPKEQESRGSASAAPKGAAEAGLQAGGFATDEPPPPSASEIRQWVTQAREGSEQAFENLVNHFKDRKFAYAMFLLRNEEDAHDVLQEAWIRCYLNLHQLREDSGFSAWLHRIVRNAAYNYSAWHTRRGKGITVSIDAEMTDDNFGKYSWEIADEAPSPRRQAEGQEAYSALQEALGKLSPEHEEILLLRFDEDLAYEEIAERLEIKIGTVKSRINRARQELRTHMGEYLDI